MPNLHQLPPLWGRTATPSLPAPFRGMLEAYLGRSCQVEAAVARTSYSFLFPPTFLIWFNTHSSMISQGATMTVKAKKWFSPHSIETRSYLIC